MIDFIKKYFRDLVYIAAFAVIILQTCGKFKGGNEKIITRDTTITTIIHDSTIVTKSQKTGTIPAKDSVIERYYYDTNKSDLRDKYIELAKKFEALNTYAQTIPIDTLGTVTIKDTIGQNELKNRSVSYNLKEKQVFVKETIQLPYQPKRQVYFGGELGVKQIGVDNISLGFLYKDRRDNIYKLGGGLNFTFQPQINLGYYKVLKFK